MRADARRTRQSLLHAGAEVFSEQGWGATVGEIARRAGVSEMSFFTYFASKEDLLSVLRAARIESHVAMALRHARRDAPAIERLEDFIWEAAADMAPHRAYVAIADQFGVVDEASIPLVRTLEETLGRLVRSAHQEGALRAGISPFDVMNVVMVGTLAAAPLARTHPTLWRRYVALSIAGLRPNAGNGELPGAAPTTSDYAAWAREEGGST
jgi:AcrR family transcriptional regulator